MYILTLCGSSVPDGVNAKLLDSLESLYPNATFPKFDILELPLFTVALDTNPLPSQVVKYRSLIAEASAVIIATPEYIHNIPAVLKSGLEWVTTSGELASKKVLAITYTPSLPRGEKAMSSLINSLIALDAQVVASLSLSQDMIKVVDGMLQADKQLEMLSTAIEMLH